MGQAIGRLGSLGIAVEVTPGTPVAAAAYLPYTDMSVQEKHEPLADIASRTSRFIDADSVSGKTWGEGDVEINCDVLNSGYLWKTALGQESLVTGTPNNHTFFTTVSGNTPTTATLYLGRDTDTMRFAYAAVDSLEFSFSDGLATLKASFMSQYPVATGTQTVTTTSGTIFSFKDASFKLGTDLSTLGSATPINEFNLTLANNVEMIYQSGSQNPTLIRNKGFKATGSFTKLYDDATEKTVYTGLTKRALELTLTGITNETLRIRIPEFRTEAEITSGLDDFFMVKSSFTAEDDVDLGARLVEVRLQNGKSTVY